MTEVISHQIKGALMTSNVAVIQYPSPRQRRRLAVAAFGMTLVVAAGVAVGRTSHQENPLPPAVAERLNPALDAPLINDTIRGASPAAVNPAVDTPQSVLVIDEESQSACGSGFLDACRYTHTWVSVPELRPDEQ
jgi:hypothetical protein